MVVIEGNSQIHGNSNTWRDVVVGSIPVYCRECLALTSPYATAISCHRVFLFLLLFLRHSSLLLLFSLVIFPLHMDRMHALSGTGMDVHVLFFQDGPPVPSLAGVFDAVALGVFGNFCQRSPQIALDGIGIVLPGRYPQDLDLVKEGDSSSNLLGRRRGCNSLWADHEWIRRRWSEGGWSRFLIMMMMIPKISSIIVVVMKDNLDALSSRGRTGE